MATDITSQALKQHDKIHPTLKATTTLKANTKDMLRQNSTTDVPADSTSSKRQSKVAVTGDSATPSKARPARMSIFKLVAATHAWQKLANKNKVVRAPKQSVEVENTYRLEPDAGNKFQSGKVKKVLVEILDSELSDIEYDAELCKELVRELSSNIKDRVKAMDFRRYKIVSSLIIMENTDQGSVVASRCIWDHRLDSFATYTYKNPSLVAIAFVHGVYFE